jgi:cytochrome P450
VTLSDWVREMAAERRSQPREDLISDLVHAQDRDDRLATDEIVILVAGLLGAGAETTALGGMIAIMTLLAEREAAARLRADRTLLPAAVNEILRFGFGGPGGVPRYALRDFELRGKTIRKGQMIMLSFGAAGRDPRAYPEPDRFDLGREAKDLVVFGSGPHFCLGAHLARAEMRCMVDAALDFLPAAATFREDRLELHEAGIFRRPSNLPVDFG